jgi:RNA polymerase sigma-70 factor (ECF subfamily)
LVQLEDLVERCRRGDALAWESLVRQAQGRVYGLAYHYLRSPEDARDVAQEVFVRFYRKLDRFDGSDVLGWLLHLTRNASIDLIRRRRARPPAEDLVVDERLSLQAPGGGAEAESIRKADRRTVRQAIDRLSELSREVVLLKEIEGMELSQISTLLGIPVGTVKSRSHRARLELAREMLKIDPSYAVEGGER